jgi:hypothetical protein
VIFAGTVTMARGQRSRSTAGSAAPASDAPEHLIPVTDPLAIQKCGTCHAADDKGNLTRISAIRTTPEGWEEAIKRMIRLNGLQLTPEEARNIVRYLSDSHGLAPEEAAPVEYFAERRIIDEKIIPDAEIQHACASCHAFAKPMSWRRNPSDWELLKNMHIAFFPSIEGSFPIDLKTRKILDCFTLNTGTENNRLSGLTVDPTGKILYSIVTTITKKIDHYEIGDPKFVAIDLEQKKIVRSSPVPKDEFPGARALMRVSPDGKSLYIFRQQILVFNTSDFKLAKKIELSNPVAPPGMDNLSLNVLDDPNEPPGKLMSIFNASDPYVHRDIFGIAEIDLSKQTFDLTPIGPAATSIQPLMLTPDRKLGYTVAINGTHGDRVTEFWVFDMATKKLISKHEFVGRTRLNFGISADGKKLLIYNAGFSIEVYDAKTLALEKTIDLEGDTTSNLIVMPTH